MRVENVPLLVKINMVSGFRGFRGRVVPHYWCWWEEYYPIVGISAINRALLLSMGGIVPQGLDKG